MEGLALVFGFGLAFESCSVNWTMIGSDHWERIEAMEKRILGVVLSIIGAIGLIYAGMRFVNGTNGNHSMKAMIFAGVLGAIFFFAGIGLVKNTRDKAT
jgi:uncharacterized membrane protein